MRSRPALGRGGHASPVYALQTETNWVASYMQARYRLVRCDGKFTSRFEWLACAYKANMVCSASALTKKREVFDPMLPLMKDMRMHPFAGQDLSTLVERRKRLHGDKAFLIWEPAVGERRIWTYGDFWSDVSRLAAGLVRRGIGSGSHVLVHLENCPEFLVAWFACARIGAVAVTTNTRLSGMELRFLADDCGAVAAITQPAYYLIISEACPKLSWIAVTSTDAGEEAAHAVPRAERFERLLLDAVDSTYVESDPWRPHSVMYTSGTTSRPKGVLWTQGNALWGARVGSFLQDYTERDVSLVFLPLFHCNALVTQILSAMWVGATVVLQRRFSAREFWPSATRNRCTIASVVPFCMHAIAEQSIPQNQFRLLISGTNNLHDQQAGVRTLGWWGMTETVVPAIAGSLQAHDEAGTIGRPSPFMQVAITNEGGATAATGEAGDLRIRGIPGLSLFSRYLGDPEVTERCFDSEGFFITGDRCRLNENGTVSFVGREKDMLKVGGENVAASEVESVVMTVSGVVEVAVVGKPHAMLDEIAVAFVIARDGADESEMRTQIAATCDANLADFKRPREIFFVQELPRATLQKVAKSQLRDLLAIKGQQL